MRKMIRAEFHIQVTALGDCDRVCNRFGHMAEGFFHFFRRFDIKGVGRESHAIFILHDFAGLYAEERVVGLVVVLVQIVTVVRCDERYSRLPGKTNEVLVGAVLLRNAVILQFQIKVLRPQDFAIFFGHGFCGIVSSLEEQRRDFARKAGRQADQPVAVRGEKTLVYPGTIIEPFEIPRGYQFYEVLVARLVSGEQQQVVGCFLMSARRLVFIEPRSGRHVQFAADNRFYSALFWLSDRNRVRRRDCRGRLRQWRACGGPRLSL